jgi:hypothetical protein
MSSMISLEYDIADGMVFSRELPGLVSRDFSPLSPGLFRPPRALHEKSDGRPHPFRVLPLWMTLSENSIVQEIVQQGGWS